jgi:hypothetical protein
VAGTPALDPRPDRACLARTRRGERDGAHHHDRHHLPQRHMPSAPAPCDVVRHLERGGTPPDGADEGFVGYGVPGVCFASGHVLGLCRWVASSAGPGHTSVWHRTPDGRWHWYADVPPALVRARCAGAFADATPVGTIRLTWRMADTLVVEVPVVGLRWVVRLHATWRTRAVGALCAPVPARWLLTPLGARALAPLARWGLGTGPVRLAGRTPDGRRFRVAPHRVWSVEHLEARLGGAALGSAVRPRAPLAVGDLRLPGRAVFATVSAHFEACDPGRQLGAAARGELDAPGPPASR